MKSSSQLLLVLIMSLASFSMVAKELKLDWKFKYKLEGYNQHFDVSYKITRVRATRNNLMFDVLAHNTHKVWYQCIFITASENSVHMDDDVGNEYAGAEVVFKHGHNNKLALNQRKLFTISIPRIHDDADSVNIHFGFYSEHISSGKNCVATTSKSNGYNFHKYDWNIGSLRRNL